MYKVRHIPTGLYYQPVTSSGTNLGKKGKIYETTSSCLSGSEDYIMKMFQDGNTDYDYYENDRHFIDEEEDVMKEYEWSIMSHLSKDEISAIDDYEYSLLSRQADDEYDNYY